MPRRKGPDSLLPPYVEEAALAQIRQLHKAGATPMTADEEADFHRRYATLPIVDETGLWLDNSPWVITRRHTLVIDQRLSDSGASIDPKYRTLMLKRRGKWVYREPGKPGADLPVPPSYMEMLNRQRNFETEAAKVKRRLAARWLYLPRQHKAEASRLRIVELAKTVKGSSRLKRIARAAGCSVATVKRALAKEQNRLTTKGRDSLMGE